MGQGSLRIIIRRRPSILRIFHIHMFMQIIFLIQNGAFSTHQKHCLPVIQKAYFIGGQKFFATMSSDEFKKDKHYPKKNFFYGICLFCFR